MFDQPVLAQYSIPPILAPPSARESSSQPLISPLSQCLTTVAFLQPLHIALCRRSVLKGLTTGYCFDWTGKGQFLPSVLNVNETSDYEFMNCSLGPLWLLGQRSLHCLGAGADTGLHSGLLGVLGTLYLVHCTLYTVLSTLYLVHCT